MPSAQIVLGGIEYTIPPLNLGQQEDLAVFWDTLAKADKAANLGVDENGKPISSMAAFAQAMRIAEILTRHATPQIKQFRLLPIGASEVSPAVAAIFRANGMQQDPKETASSPSQPGPEAA